MACQARTPTATPRASIATSSGEPARPGTNDWCDLVGDRVQHAERERRPGATGRAQEQRAEDRVLRGMRDLPQHEIPAAEPGAEIGDGREGEDERRPRDDRQPQARARPRHRPMIGSAALRSTVREPGANPGRSRRCEGRRSSATKPLARSREGGEGGSPESEDLSCSHNRTPRGREDQVLRSSLHLAVAALAALAVAVTGALCRLGGAERVPRHRRRSSGKVTVSKRPTRIVSLSPTATETLFAIGAGSQVVAVDDQSDYPKSAPKTTLSGFTPNVEAIAAYRPDLVVIAYDPKGLSAHSDGSASPCSTTTAPRPSRARTSRSASSVSSPAARRGRRS